MFVSHLMVLFGLLALVLVFDWPVIINNLPPGVDTPTFLHLGRTVELALSGKLDNPFIDPYWYGGFAYVKAYSPVSFGLIGVISLLTPLDHVDAYKLLVIVFHLFLGVTTYFLALELGLRRWPSALSGALTTLAYPVLTSTLMWGWFSSLAALPIALLALLLLERSLKHQRTKFAFIGGLLFALSILTHHMTAFAFGIGLTTWFLATLATRQYTFAHLIKTCAVFGSISVLAALPWALPFLTHWTDVGFSRPVPGNWVFSPDDYRRVLLDTNYIGRFFYPSYLGTVLLPLGLMGMVYSLLAERRLAPTAILMLTFLWFSMGAEVNPLYMHKPFSSLDVARFHLFATPFLALGAGILVEAFLSLINRQPRLSFPNVITWSGGTVATMILLIFPLIDGWRVKESVQPFHIKPHVQESLNWASNLPEDASGKDKIFDLGFQNWGTYIIPELAGRPVAHGWNDEGAKNWKPIQELRLLAFFAEPNAVKAHSELSKLGAKYVLIYNWYPYQHPWVFQQAFQDNPDLFAKIGEWESDSAGKIMAFEVLKD